jgi:aryl-alcohol dehydrogenase-like predicted oxidoreductase
MSGAYGPEDPSKWEGLIRKAYDRGVSFFDTSEAYVQSEEILGRAVAPFREKIVLASKVGLPASGGPDASRGHVVEACEGSLRRLGTDRIDLYQIEFADPATPVAETVEALEGLRSQGKIREYGVGHLPLAVLREYCALGRPASMLVELSAVMRAAKREILPFLGEAPGSGGDRPAGSGRPAAVAISPTGRGLLTGAITAETKFGENDIRAVDPLFTRAKLASALRVRDRLAGVGQRLGHTPTQTAIAWVLAQPGIHAALTGPTHPDLLEENLGALGWDFPAKDLAEIASFLAVEDERVALESLTAAQEIVAAPLCQDGDTAYRDLLFAMETAVELGELAEEDIIPLVMRLLKLRKENGGRYHAELEGLREDLGRMALVAQ